MLRKNNHRSSSSMVMTKEQPSSSPRQSSVPSFMAAASPRFFNGFLARTLSEPEYSATMSPTSILDAKPFDPTSDSLQSRNSFEKINGVGLAILDSLLREKNGAHLVNKSNSKMVLFGAKLKVQIPAAAAIGGGVSPVGGGTPKSPGDFGIKTRNAHLFVPPSGFGSPLKGSKVSPRELDLSEMELSEDYTCVITHGPNPKTTHIFDDCVVEDCCGVVKLPELKGKDYGFPTAEDGGGGEDHEVSSFLKVCDSCSECLGHGKDVFMYRGEMAFCSHECRSQEMNAEGGKNLED